MILNVARKQEYREVLEELRAALDRWIQKTHNFSPTKRMVDMYDWETGKRTDPGPRRLPEIHEKQRLSCLCEKPRHKPC